MDKHIYGTTGTQIYSCGTNKYTFVGLVGLTNILLWDYQKYDQEYKH